MVAKNIYLKDHDHSNPLVGDHFYPYLAKTQLVNQIIDEETFMKNHVNHKVKIIDNASVV